jgi:hypothetical protein
VRLRLHQELPFFSRTSLQGISAAAKIQTHLNIFPIIHSKLIALYITQKHEAEIVKLFLPAFPSSNSTAAPIFRLKQVLGVTIITYRPYIKSLDY